MSLQTFGSCLSRLRIQRGFGLRAFAEKINCYPSNLSDIERGKKTPPQDPKKLAEIAKALNITENSEEWTMLHNLAVKDRPERIPPDLVKYAEKSEMVPLLFRTVAQKKLTKEQLLRLIETIKKHF